MINNATYVSLPAEAKRFIDESFKTLRSAEGAFDLLLKFKHIKSREAINNQMMRKFNDILAQYMKEVSASSRHCIPRCCMQRNRQIQPIRLFRVGSHIYKFKGQRSSLGVRKFNKTPQNMSVA